jgi:hypothetical protein
MGHGLASWGRSMGDGAAMVSAWAAAQTPFVVIASTAPS